LAQLRQKFPKISENMMEEGIFVVPQMKQVLKEQYLSTKLNFTKGCVWKACENVCINFLGNEKGENYSKILLLLLL
jgi:hypothetical protein